MCKRNNVPQTERKKFRGKNKTSKGKWRLLLTKPAKRKLVTNSPDGLKNFNGTIFVQSVERSLSISTSTVVAFLEGWKSP